MTTTFVSYYDTINESKARAFMAACAEAIAQTKPERLYFLFSSSGGSVDAGIALYNYLRALPVPVTMHNTGSIDSIANVVFLAADERYANPHATFLLHGITWGFGQGAQLTWSQLQETVSRFRADENRMTGIITQRTTLTQDDLTDFFHQGQTKDLVFAKQKGLIQDIREAKVTQGAPFFALNFA
jgi:ATP-dependent Clp protease protease subunit